MRRLGPVGCCAGTTAIETAILLPLFLLMFFGVVEFGRAMWMESTLQQAVEAAARCTVDNATTCDSVADTQTYAASQVSGFTVDSGAFKVSWSTTCGTGVTGNQVSVSLPFTFVAPKLFVANDKTPFAITLSAQSCHPS